VSDEASKLPIEVEDPSLDGEEPLTPTLRFVIEYWDEEGGSTQHGEAYADDLSKEAEKAFTAEVTRGVKALFAGLRIRAKKGKDKPASE